MKIKLENLESLIKEGYISCKYHDSAPYRILNYTAKCQYEQMWNKMTLQCRGLILDNENNVIAKPFSKFFNVGEYNQHSHLGKIPYYNYFDIFDKLDGSLGILYIMPNGDYKIATRGSFESPQVKVGTEIWELKYDFHKLDNAYTYLFEIVYPENRIVVNYGDKKDLMLLAVIHKETGEEYDYVDLLKLSEKIGCPMTQYYGRKAYNRHAFLKLIEDIPEGNEGFVLHFDNGLRVKIKSDEYVRLHRLITGVSNKSIWELLSNGQDVDELLDRVPDEFYDWVKKTTDKFKSDYKLIETSCRFIIADIRKGFVKDVNATDIKAVALYFCKGEYKRYRAILFPMFKGKAYEHLIWRSLKPEYSKPFQMEN